MKKLAIGTFLVLSLLVTPAVFADFCGWEVPQQTRTCSEGYFFECRTWCQSLMTSGSGWVCTCDSKCTYVGECTQVASYPETETDFIKFQLREAAIAKAKAKVKKVKKDK